MENTNLLSIVGLIFDLIGTILIFKYGIPSTMYNRPISKKEQKFRDIYYGKSDTLKWEEIADKLDIKHKNKIIRNSKIGFWFIITGFCFQLSAYLASYI